MKRNSKHIYLLRSVILLFLFCPVLFSVAQSLTPHAGQLTGKTYIHKVSDSRDSLSAQQIIEYRNENGLSSWFARDIQKAVCLDEKCNMVQLRIFWDGAANYLKFEIPENHPLTKTDHTVFNPNDYQKLHSILSDSTSILEKLRMEELIVEKDPVNKEGVDAVTAATKPALKNYLVKNAAYTCYTLWHTVYGPTHDIIQTILEKRADSDYLNALFKSQEPQYILWAINFIDKNPELQAAFNDSIFSQIFSGDLILSQRAFNYFSYSRLSNPEIQKKMGACFGIISPKLQNQLILRYSLLERINNDAYVHLLEQYKKNYINAGQLRKIIESVEPENVNSPAIKKMMKILSEDSNPFVRSLVRKHLE